MLVTAEGGRALRVHSSHTGHSLTVTTSSGYATVAVLPLSPELGAELRREAGRYYVLRALMWVLAPQLDKKTIPRLE
jgi:hypothetical protein